MAIKQNLKGIENKKVLITSKLKKNYRNIISNTNKFKAKLLSSQDKVSRSQQN